MTRRLLGLTAYTIAVALMGAMIGATLMNASASAERTAALDRHTDSDARLRVECVRMGMAAERGLVSATEHLWRHRGPTGGEMFTLTNEGE